MSLLAFGSMSLLAFGSMSLLAFGNRVKPNTDFSSKVAAVNRPFAVTPNLAAAGAAIAVVVVMVLAVAARPAGATDDPPTRESNVSTSVASREELVARQGQPNTPFATAEVMCRNYYSGRIAVTVTNPTSATVTFLVSIESEPTSVKGEGVEVSPFQTATVNLDNLYDSDFTVTVDVGSSRIFQQVFTVACDAKSGPFPVILNEWNAVSPSNFLEDDGTDSTFGRVLGNGGDWFELVVTDPDGVDLRGWTLELTGVASGVRKTTNAFEFSSINDLAAVPGGTIITVAEDFADDFDLSDKHLNLQANSAAEGIGFTAGSQSDFDTNGDDWWLTIRDASGAAVFGPVGLYRELSEPALDRYVFTNSADPSAEINTNRYGSERFSSFGKPNVTYAGERLQSFETYWGPNPTVAVRPTTCAASGGIVRVEVTNNYSTSVAFGVQLTGQLTNFSATKTLTLAPGETDFIGFSGRPDGIYDVSVDADGATVTTLVGFYGPEPNGALVHCGDDEVTIVASTCLAERGTIYLAMRNDSTKFQEVRARVWYETQAIDDGAETNFGGIERIRRLAPGERYLEPISGRELDIGVLMTARIGYPGFAWANGAEVGSGSVLVDCKGEPTEVGVLNSCRYDDGRIDVFFRRPDATATKYRVTVKGPKGFTTTRTVDLADQASGRVTITGRPDGNYPIRTEKLVGATWIPLDITPTSVIVSCDQIPTVAAAVRTTCLAGAGRIDVALGNSDPTAASFVVTVQDGKLRARQRSVSGYGRSTVTFTGRSDGTIPIVVTKNGDTVLSGSTVVACK